MFSKAFCSSGVRSRDCVVKSFWMILIMNGFEIINPFRNKPCFFLRVCSTILLKTLWEKEKLLVKSNFSISQSVFYPFGELSAIFNKSEIVVCKLFQFGKSLKFVGWERIKGKKKKMLVARIVRHGVISYQNDVMVSVHTCIIDISKIPHPVTSLPKL